MNYRLGFSKSVNEYLQFAESCSERLHQDSANNGLLDTCRQFTFVKSYGGNGTDVFFDLKQTFDGGYILTGTTTSFGNGGTDGYIVKTDSRGNVIWSKTYGGSGDDDLMKIRQTPDSGYIAIGTTKSYHQAQGEIFVVKIDAAGSVTQAEGLHKEPQMVRSDSILYKPQTEGMRWRVYIIPVPVFPILKC